MIISSDKEKKEQACEMLIKKAAEIGHAPIKSDFSEEEIVFIKAHLGPWSRALEAAGLKEKRKNTYKNRNKNRLKRKRAAQNAETEP